MRFAFFSWGVLGYNLAVILWGAYVRATGSGAGCGDHWPLCQGMVLPRDPGVQTLIEFSHRVSSGLSLVLVGVLWWWSRKQNRPVHRAAFAAWVLIWVEAALGAGLVLLKLVALDASVSRAVAISLHLINTSLLLGALTKVAFRSLGGSHASQGVTLSERRTQWLLTTGLLVLGVSGAIAALGDTLFPAQSFAEGARQDFAVGAHFLLRLRVFHPVFAMIVGTALLVRAYFWIPVVGGRALALAGLVLIQWIVGFTNLALLAPVSLQLIHLLCADLVWIAWVACLERRR